LRASGFSDVDVRCRPGSRDVRRKRSRTARSLPAGRTDKLADKAKRAAV